MIFFVRQILSKVIFSLSIFFFICLCTALTGDRQGRFIGSAHAEQVAMNRPDILVLSDFLPNDSLKRETDFRAVVTQEFSEEKNSVIVKFTAPQAGYRVAVLLKLKLKLDIGIGAFAMYSKETWTIHPFDQIKKEEDDSEVRDLAWSSGAVHQYSNTVRTAGYIFSSDRDYPLTFKVVKGKGYTYLCGRGTVTNRDGKSIRLGNQDTITTWLRLLASDDPFSREAATQALGFLTSTDKEKDLVAPALIKVLHDDVMEVRRNATEALGRLADPRATEALTSRTQATVEEDKWVRKVAEESLKVIQLK